MLRGFQKLNSESLRGFQNLSRDFMTEISIVIPTYNHARYVAQAIDSALGQTHAEREIIVVDDGSTDGTQAVLQEYGERIVSIRQANAGLSAARNAGLALARGEYVLFLDADDLIPPHKLAMQGAYLDAHPEYGLTYGAWQHIDAGGGQLLREVRPRRSGAVLHALLRREFFPAIGSVLVRRSCFDHVGNFDPALRAAEDMDMWLRIAVAGYRFGYQDEVLFYYRDTPGSMSTRLENQLHYELRRIDKFFASPDLPVGCAEMRGIAVAAIYFEYAARYTGAGDAHAAKRCLEAALSIGPELAADDEWMIGWISGFLASFISSSNSHESAPEILDQLIMTLPRSEQQQQRMRRRAQGRMHADALFRAYDGWLRNGAWRHILPALSCEPQLLSNRGFWKVAMAAVVGATRPQSESRQLA